MARKLISSYVFSFACVILAIVGRLVLDPELGLQYPFATVFLAIVGTAWYGGSRPALLAVVLGAIASDFFLIAPRGSFHLTSPAERVGMALYLVTGLGISLLAGSMHSARERARLNAESAAKAEIEVRAFNQDLEKRVADRTEELREQAFILDLARDTIFIRDAGDRITYWNEGAQRLYGWNREEAMGHVTHALLSTKFPQPLDDIRAHLLATGAWHGELVHTRRDGTLLTVASHWTLRRAASNRPASVIELNFDITARRLAEQELEKSRSRLDAIFQNSHDGVIVYTAIRDEAGVLQDLRFAMVNPAAEALLRLAKSEITGHTLLQKFPQVASDGLFTKFSRAIAENTNLETEYQLPVQGIPRWYRIAAGKVGDGLVVNFSEITSRKMADEQKQMVANRLGLATDFLHAGIWEWDIRSGLLEWDERMHETYGLSMNSAVEYADWAHAVASEDLPRAEAALRDAIASKSQGSTEFRIARPDATIRHIRSVFGAILGDGGNVVRVVGASIDVTESKRTEERFQLLVEAAPNSMIVVGGDGRMVLVNSQTEKLFGYRRGELLGQPVEMLVPLRFRSSHCVRRGEFFAKPVVRAGAAQQKLSGLHKDGTEIPLEIGLNPVDSGEGQLVLASIVDITERKRTEERLHLLAAIIEGARDYATFMLDPEGRILTWNEGAARIKGYSQEEIVGKHFSVFYTRDNVSSGHPENELRIARAVGRFEEEGWRVRRDGSVFWASVLITAIHDSDGSLRGFSKLTRDITERRRTEERFQRVVEASPSALIMVCEQGLITLVNTQTEKLFGYDRRDLLGRHIEMLVPERFRPHHSGHRGSFFAAPEARAMGAGRDLFGARKDGSEIPIEIGLSPIVTADGAFVLASVIDITERKRFQTELQSKAAEMERFAYTASHDLKSPILTIKSYISMIEQDLAAERLDRVRPDLQRVARAADKMHVLLEEVLSLARVGRVETTRESVAFGLLVDEALELVAGRLQQSHARVEVAGELPSVTVDRHRIVEVLQNLVDNAVKYMGTQTAPEILIGARSHESEMRFFVKDNGAGLEPQHHTRIFGLFNKLDPKSEGSGAGLAIVKRIIELHGGRIWVESAGSGGSTFWFTLSPSEACPEKDFVPHESIAGENK